MTIDDLARARILITGGHGFLGSHLASHLRGLGATNIALVGRAHYDLTDRDACNRMLAAVHPDIVFHLAAVVGGIGANRNRPADFLYHNAIMGLNLIEAMRIECPRTKLVMVGTVCSYPKHASVPFKEADLWSGYPEETNAPYGIAKKMLLVASQAYRQQYGMSIIYLLPVNLYGERDNFDAETSHVIPALIRKFIEARDSGAAAVTLWGTGQASREFLHVKDAARALALAAASYDSPAPVNVGSGHEITIAALAAKIAAITGFRGKILYDPLMPDGQPHRCLDVFRAEVGFGFKAAIDFDEGLRETVAWYEAARKPAVDAK